MQNPQNPSELSGIPIEIRNQNKIKYAITMILSLDLNILPENLNEKINVKLLFENVQEHLKTVQKSYENIANINKNLSDLIAAFNDLIKKISEQISAHNLDIDINHEQIVDSKIQNDRDESYKLITKTYDELLALENAIQKEYNNLIGGKIEIKTSKEEVKDNFKNENQIELRSNYTGYQEYIIEQKRDKN